MQAANTGQEILQHFKQYLQEDGKAASTIESYVGDIAAFVAWLEEMVALRLKDMDLLTNTRQRGRLSCMLKCKNITNNRLINKLIGDRIEITNGGKRDG